MSRIIQNFLTLTFLCLCVNIVEIMTLSHTSSKRELWSQKERPLLWSSTLTTRNKFLLCGPHHVPTATGMHATIEELLETVCSMQSAPRLRKKSILRYELVQFGSRSTTGSSSCRLAGGSQPSPGANRWRKYQRKPAVRAQGWREMVATLQGRESGSRGTSDVGSRCQPTWLRTLVCVW
jgi:hypothetical protein